jgi:ATP-dependent helicase/nuclease subunit B
MTEAGTRITDGAVDLDPFQKNQQVACEFCSYRSVCQFDPTLEEHNYRKLQDLKDEDVLERLTKGKEDA